MNGLLLINLGTPDNSNVTAVRRYLSEFLVDKRVITLPAVLRYLLVYGIILPIRSKKSAVAYQAIWTEDGSPLLLHSQRLVKKLQQQLGNQYKVVLGMRYGNPSLQQALEQLNDCQNITILPLYPQYSSAATGSSIDKILQLLSTSIVFPSLHIIRDFHDHAQYIAAQTALIKPHLANHDYLLLSYHGVPKHHIVMAGCKKQCVNACPSTIEATRRCYRAQCFHTSLLLANSLELTKQHYGIAFQSRLGRSPWIEPYADTLLPQLIKKGIRRLAVACPSFVADCLETLEEIGLRMKEQWLNMGGTHFTLIPALNESDEWVSALVNVVCVGSMQDYTSP